LSGRSRENPIFLGERPNVLSLLGLPELGTVANLFQGEDRF
jgi:hypothetical protein